MARYRFFFYTADRGEPAHVHVTRERKEAKFWLEAVRSEFNKGFAQNELSTIEGLVREHQATLLKAWHDFFKSGNGNGGS